MSDPVQQPRQLTDSAYDVMSIFFFFPATTAGLLGDKCGEKTLHIDDLLTTHYSPPQTIPFQRIDQARLLETKMTQDTGITVDHVSF